MGHRSSGGVTTPERRAAGPASASSAAGLRRDRARTRVGDRGGRDVAPRTGDVYGGADLV